jgi:hypothetical protein
VKGFSDGLIIAEFGFQDFTQCSEDDLAGEFYRDGGLREFMFEGDDLGVGGGKSGRRSATPGFPLSGFRREGGRRGRAGTIFTDDLRGNGINTKLERRKGAGCAQTQNS